MNRRAFTMIELLVVLALLAACFSVATAVSRPSHAWRAARSLRATLLWARTEAMWRGEAVSVTELDGGAGLTVRMAPGAECAAGPELAAARLGEHPGVRLAAGLPRGVVWLPSGSGRSCNGGGVISATILVADQRSEVAVVVSSLGRVRLEERP